MTLLSVIIPSYNHARYIEKALRSVLDQDYPELELIIIDDGSKDDSDAIIRATIADPGRVRVEYHPQANAGAHAAITRGLSLARGEVLTILNSDDYFEPGRFSQMMAAVPRDRDFIAFSRLRLIDDAGITLPTDAPLQAWYDRALLDAAQCPTVGYALLRNNISITSGNLVFTRGLYDKVGGFRDFKMCHDWDFLMRATHHVEPIYVQRALMAYRYHENNTLRSTAHLLEAEGVPAFNTFVDLGLAEVPPNPLCPSHAHWPSYFPQFVGRYPSWFSPSPMGQYIRSHVAPAEPATGLAQWAENPRLGLHGREFLTDAGRARDAYALLREASFARGDKK
ncbi:MAG: hypothetical protein JWR10_3796 [Rubritepida sp.]|nr:hypothetical protein [Rubritepida sp.]